MRKERITAYQKELSIKEYNEPLKDLEQREFFNPTEVSKLLGIGRTSTYRYIRTGQIKVVRFNGKTLIRRTDIEQMFDFLQIQDTESKPKEKAPIAEFYTTAEVKEKYNVVDS